MSLVLFSATAGSMKVVQMRHKQQACLILFSVLVVSVLLTLGKIPLAVSQAVIVPVWTTSGVIPMDVESPLWETVPGIVVPLSGQTITTPMHPNISVKTILVKMVTNGKEIGILANWGDQTLSNTTIGSQNFHDQMAVQFPVQSADAPPFQCMGQSNQAVNIWRWNAGWQLDMDRRIAGMWDVDKQNLSIAWDLYYQEPASGAAASDRMSQDLGPFNPELWSRVIIADPDTRNSSVEDIKASGFNTLITQASQDVMGNGLWEPSGALKSGSTWRVVMKRAVTTNDPNDVQFEPGASLSVAFAVWDGQNMERRGMKGISTWFTAKMP